MTRFPTDAEIVDGEHVSDAGLPAVAPGTGRAASPRHLNLERAPAVVPARQAAALAATSFVAGAAAVAVASRRAPRLTRRRGRRARKGVVGEILSSNSFLVDVHLVRRG